MREQSLLEEVINTNITLADIDAEEARLESKVLMLGDCFR